MNARSARAFLLISAMIVSGCSGGSGTSLSPPAIAPPNAGSVGKATPSNTYGNTAAARAMSVLMPAAKSPASFHVAPMTVSAQLPSSAMTSLTPQNGGRSTESVSTPNFTQIPGAATQVVAADTGTSFGVQLWALSTAPSGPNKSIFTYGTNGVWTNIPGSASRLAVSPDNATLYAINGTSGALYAYSGFGDTSAAIGTGGTWNALGGGVSDVAVAGDGTTYVLSNGTANGDNAIFQYAGGRFAQIPGAGYRLATSWDGVDYNLSGIGTLTHGGVYVVNAEGYVFYYSPGNGYIQLPGKTADIAPVVGGYFLLGDTNGSGDETISFEDFATQIETLEPGSAVDLSAVAPQLYAVNAEGAIFSGSVAGPSGVVVSTLAGSPGQAAMTDGFGSAARFGTVQAIAVAPGGDIYVSDLVVSSQYEPALRVVTPDGTVKTVDADAGGTEDYLPAIDHNNNVFLTNNFQVYSYTPSGGEVLVAGGGNEDESNGVGSSPQFVGIDAIAAGPDGSLYVADVNANPNNICAIRKITNPLANGGGTVGTLAGSACGYADGIGTTAQFSNPTGIAVAPNGTVYVADGSRVRAITPSGNVSTIAGSGTAGYVDGSASSAQVAASSIAVEPNGDIVVTSGNAVREITPGGITTTLAGGYGSPFAYENGTGAGSEFSSPSAIAVNSSGLIYVYDDHTIRAINRGQ